MTSSLDSPFALSQAGNVAYSASPGVPPIVLPLRSAGLWMFLLSRNSIDDGPFCRNTPTLLTFMCWAMPLRSGGVSAQPNVVFCWATCWMVLPEPVPDLIVRSMPSLA